ncbi:unnamed protein product [Caenorhabditis angaria]|uniref:U4/U6.U5 tri-snRNP-associated protein 1 n=1 Tax=Caenorhabditis angaria TaxID=860376 RepID=A0A9P1N6K9_9PELO|nr:unnamed protein product [Caenorhabditis angaria]
MIKTNSYDTPLGTLSKQLKKQKQLSTPYLVLSGSNDQKNYKKSSKKIIVKNLRFKNIGNIMKKPTKNDSTAGLVVGHNREDFLEDAHQILVLQDKGVLDDSDEVLVNPNLLENEMHRKNVELRKSRNPRDSDGDLEGGSGILAKYDSDLGPEKGPRKFRLDHSGNLDLAEEKRELEMFEKLKMAGKRLETLDNPEKYKLASEFYTQDEMIEFRKNKKGKKERNSRKTKKMLKASDLQPIPDERRDFGRRRRDSEEEPEKPAENQEFEAETDGKWKKAMHGNGVDLERLQKLKKTVQKESDEEDSEAGLVVGHNREDFLEDAHQILVLQDKGVLDDSDEVLVNPNLLENEMHRKNVELRKSRNPRDFDGDLEGGSGILAKYDSDLGPEKGPRKFRLDHSGNLDLAEEKRELEMFEKLKMAGKRLETLDNPEKYKLASEFYTQDEMVEFRKNKKGKKERNSRKTKKMLKASDLQPIPDERRDFGRRRRDSEEEPEKPAENAEFEAETDGKWKKAMHGNGVDLERLQKLKKTVQKESDEEDSEDDFPSGGVDLTGIVIDDDAEDELHSILSKTRKVRQNLVDFAENPEENVGKRVQKMMEDFGNLEENQPKKEGIFIDSTMEYCRHIGEIDTLGLGGNRKEKELLVKKEIKEEEEKEEENEKDDEGFEKWKRDKIDKELREKEKRRREEKGGWLAAGKPVQSTSTSQLDSDDEEAIEEAKKRKWNEDEEDSEEDSEEKEDYQPALGKEADVSKGVGAMLKLAAQKGYLTDPNSKSYKGPSLEHLKNHAKTQIDGGRFDIEDKYMKKLDRLGTTSSSRGPIQAFPEKLDYHPDVNISYVDKKGREMDAKDAYRELSYKFHGRNPGKKQLEKRANRKDKEERMLKTNSYDTPLGTLSKQLKKQKQLSTPYLVLSGSNDHSSLKKE